ncbi:MAG: porin [Acidobacteriota bacterium]
MKRMAMHARTVSRGALALFGFLVAAASPAQVQVKVSEDVNFRLGFQIQGWADWLSDPVTRGFSRNMFLRRVRLIVAGQVARNVTFFFQTDDQRLGNAGTGTTTPTRSLTAGFVVQDAFGEWRIAGEKIMLDAGVFYVPQSRNVLTSTSSTLACDGASFVQQQNAATAGNGGRDVGLALKGYLQEDRLEYRAGVFDGQRAAATGTSGSRNAPRFAGRVQYDFLDVEKGYTYVGTNRGSRKIVVVGGWADGQGDFLAWGADAAMDLPVAGGAATAELDYAFFDGGRQFLQTAGGVTTSLLPRESTITAQTACYHAATKLQPFVRYEKLTFSDAALRTRDQRRFGAGINWFVAANNLKISGLYERIEPAVPVARARVKDMNHFAVQIQIYYF